MNTTTDTKWVAMWGNAMSMTCPRPESYAKNITLRYPTFAPFDGSAIRLTFDNFCGPEPVTITKACVAIADARHPSIIDPDTSVEIFWDRNTSVTIEAGASVVSDPVILNVQAGQWVVVSFYLADFTNMISGVNVTGPLSKGYYAVGDECRTKKLPADTSKSINWVYFLSTVDILTKEQNHAVICYGDSITAQDWPDFLMKRMWEEQGKDLHTSIIRRAVSGTRILLQYDCLTYRSYGLKGDIRFPHEIPDTAGADAIILQQGINDIIHPVGLEVNKFRPMSDLPTVQELSEGLSAYVTAAKKYGMKAYLGTLLPIYNWRTYADFREILKNELNDWMRTTDIADGCIDFDLAVRDPEKTAAFRDGFDSGDHLHPSTAAYKAMADAAYEFLFSK